MKSICVGKIVLRNGFSRMPSQICYQRGFHSSLSRGRSSSPEAERSEVNTPPAGDAEFFDIVIAGGGPVGTTLAVALGQLGRLSDKKILLLESADKFFATPPPLETESPSGNSQPEFSNRVVAVAPGSKSFLSKLGIWEHVWRSQPVSSLQVWDALSDANIAFHDPDYSNPVAHIVENAVLGHAISQVLEEANNVTVSFGSKLKSCKIPSPDKSYDKAFVTLDDNRYLSTDLLIGADGFNSRVRAAMNSPYIGFNYDRTAVVATLQLNEPTDNRVAWQRFLPTGGPIALLPLSPEFSSLVWSTTAENAKNLLKMSSEEFVDEINSAFWHEHTRSDLVKKSCELLSTFNLGGSSPKIYPPSIMEVVEKSRASFPLGFGHAAYYVSRRSVIIGDAAHRVHPLAGQGLNLGIGDVETLQRVLHDIAGIGGDIGNLDLLKEYETERQRHNLAIQGGVDFLHRLYSFDLSPIVALRTVGLSLVNSSPMLKKLIISQAAA